MSGTDSTSPSGRWRASGSRRVAPTASLSVGPPERGSHGPRPARAGDHPRVHLRLTPRVEGVVDREGELELTVVAQVQEEEALGDGQEPARLRCRVAVVAHVGTVDDPRQQLQRRIVDPVVLDQYLERTEAVPVRVLGVWRVV